MNPKNFFAEMERRNASRWRSPTRSWHGCSSKSRRRSGGTPQGGTPALQTEVELTFDANRNQLFTGWNAMANLADIAGKVKVTVRAENADGLDNGKLQNGVIEPLREADLIEWSGLKCSPKSFDEYLPNRLRFRANPCAFLRSSINRSFGDFSL